MDSEVVAPYRFLIYLPPKPALVVKGRTGNPASRTVNSLHALVDLVGAELAEPAMLVAQSMGAVVAVLAASRWPDAVTHLVLVATSGGLDMAQLGAQDWRPGYRQLWPKAPEWAFDAPPEMTRALRSLAMPVLVVTGTNDPISPAPVARQLATLIP